MNGIEGAGLLLWLFTAAIAVAATIALGVAWRRRSRPLAAGVGIGLGAWLVAYASILVAVSAASEERVLPRGETKWFCGVYLDCHLGVAVEGVRTAAALGEGPTGVRATGRFWIVTLRVENSARRVSLALARPSARVIDAAGATYPRALDAERRLRGGPAGLERSIPAAGRITVEIVFDLPADIEAPRLLVTEDWLPDRLAELVLIGDDDSLLHAPTTLRI